MFLPGCASFQVALALKGPPAMQEMREMRVPSLGGKIPWRGHGNPLQYSCPENPLDRGAWRAIVHGVAELDTTESTQHTRGQRHTELLAPDEQEACRLPLAPSCSTPPPRGAGDTGDHALLHREWLVSGTATRPGQPCWAETGPRGELRLGGRGLPSPSAPDANRVAASWEPCGLKGLDS